MSDEVSLSIEETNRLRIQMGLKPLDLEAKPKEKKAEENYAAKRAEEQEHKEQEELRQKIEKLKNKRLMAQKLKGSTLAEDEPDDALSWVLKSKQAAQKMSQMFEEQDEEVQEQARHYDTKDLAGVRVGHDVRDFDYGEERILTLKDSNVLENEEEGDELESIQMAERERLNRNLELKKKKGAYKAYDDDEFSNDPFKPKSLLSQYDEEIYGQQKKSFFLTSEGTAPVPSEDQIAGRLKAGAVSLDVNKMQEIRDYYTDQEMTKFKKVKVKKVKVRAKQPLSEVLGLAPEASSSSAAAASSSSNGEAMDVEQATESAAPVAPAEPVNLDRNFVDDEDLQLAIARQRREAIRKRPVQKIEDVAAAAREARLKDEHKEASPEASSSGGLVFSSTSEFVRNLGAQLEDTTGTASTVPLQRVKEEEEEGAGPSSHGIEVKMEVDEEAQHSEDEAGGSAGERSRESSMTPDFTTQEPLVAKGLAATLQLLKSKGVLESATPEQLERERRQREYQQWTIEQRKKDAEREKQKEKDRRARAASRASGSSSGASDRREDDSLRERDRELQKKFADYKPDVNIEYTDQFGRKLTPKEAFKQLSHTFHGKGPGKKKTEKQLRKIEEEVKEHQVSSLDTPLHVLTAMREQQKKSGNAFVVLSSGNKTGIETLPMLGDKQVQRIARKEKKQEERAAKRVKNEQP